MAHLYSSVSLKKQVPDPKQRVAPDFKDRKQVLAGAEIQGSRDMAKGKAVNQSNFGADKYSD